MPGPIPEPDDELVPALDAVPPPALMPAWVVPFERGTVPDWRTLFGFARVAKPTAGGVKRYVLYTFLTARGQRCASEREDSRKASPKMTCSCPFCEARANTAPTHVLPELDEGPLLKSDDCIG